MSFGQTFCGCSSTICSSIFVQISIYCWFNNLDSSGCDDIMFDLDLNIQRNNKLLLVCQHILRLLYLHYTHIHSKYVLYRLLALRLFTLFGRLCILSLRIIITVVVAAAAIDDWATRIIEHATHTHSHKT